VLGYSSIKGRENFPANMTYNNDRASSDSDKAQLFNNYFYSVFSTTDDIPTTNPKHQSSSPILHEIHFSNSDVLVLLTSLDISKACGIDNYSPKIFKYCAMPLLQVICHLFRTSLSHSSIPQKTGELTVWSLYTNLETKPLSLITDPYHCCVSFPRYWKELCTIIS